MKKSIHLWLFAFVACLMSAIGARAAEAYACYTPSNTTLTFFCDNYRSSRTGTTYDLSTGDYPSWLDISEDVTHVVFNSSFAGARPTSTRYWFGEMEELISITGMQYLNTSQVTNMSGMFDDCISLTSIDVSHFDTSQVTDMSGMFMSCGMLRELDVSNFNVSQVTNMYRMFASCSSLTSLDVAGDYGYWDSSNVTNMDYMFAGCSSLTSLDLSQLKTSNVTSMQNMFNGCSSLTSLDVRGFNTANVTNMNYMFYNCDALAELDLEFTDFNTSKVTSMNSMFASCDNLVKIYVGLGWSTAAVTTSTNMFKDSYRLYGEKGTSYNASHVDAAYAHVDGGTSNPGYMSDRKEAYACYTPSNHTLTFYYDDYRSSRSGTTYDLNTDINTTPAWHTDGTCSDVTTVLFASSFADARPTNTRSWFAGMEKLTSVTGMRQYLNTSAVTFMHYMFDGCSSLTSLDVSSFNTANLETTAYMFYGCSSLTSLDLSSFNTSEVYFMFYMFQGCTNLRTIYVGDGWSTAAVTSSSGMFDGCTSLVGGMGTAYDANHVDKAYAHIDGGTANPGYLSEKPAEAYACYTPGNTTLTFYYDGYRSSRTGTTYDLNEGEQITPWENDGTNANVTKVVFDSSFADARPTTTYSWFYDMKKLTSITGINYLNTSEVTNMACTFMMCYALTSLDLSGFNTSKVTKMTEMFYYCKALTSIDVSGFNTSNVTNMYGMFYYCSGLTTIYAGSGWSTAAVTSSSGMFTYCTSLVGGMGTAYSASHTDATYAHIDGGTANPGYFTDKNASLRGDVNGDGNVNISDVTALINYLLSGNAAGVNLGGADVNQDGNVNISDVTALINYLLSGTW